MSPEDQLTRLFDKALPEVPQALLGAPIRTIHRLARRRRRRIATVTTAAVAVLVVMAVMAVYLVRPVHRGAPAVPTRPEPRPLTSEFAARLMPWQLARVTRDGTHITVYAQPPAGTCFPDLVAQAVPATTSVGIGVAPSERGAVTCDPTQNGAESVTVTLDAPLGNRQLVDLSGNAPRRGYLDNELPEFPGGVGWHEVPGTYNLAHGVYLAILFDRGDGLDVDVTAADPSPVAGTKKGAVTLGRRTGQIYVTGTSNYKVVWTVGDQQYMLRVTPNEGDTETLTAFKDLISSLRWNAQ